MGRDKRNKIKPESTEPIVEKVVIADPAHLQAAFLVLCQVYQALGEQLKSCGEQVGGLMNQYRKYNEGEKKDGEKQD